MKKQFHASQDYFWAEYKQASQTESEYFAILDNVKQDESIEIVAPYFKDSEGKKIGLSNFFYVKLKAERDLEALKSISDKYSVAIIEQNKFMPLWYTLSCSKKSPFNAMQMANIYYETGQFQYAEPDLMVDNLLQCASDALWSNQWNLLNTGQYSGTVGLDVKACDAWGITKGDNIKVAVVDQGIDLSHEDLIDNIHPLSYDAETGTSPSVVRGSHGTACAGIIGANDNNIGVTGIAPNCKLMSVSHSIPFTVTPAIQAEFANGINWSWQNGADIISNSWSRSSNSSLIDDAISNALNFGRNGKGCVVVFSSGNYSSDNSSAVAYPANSNSAILTVGAISQCGQRKSYTSCDNEAWGSCFGTELDVIAPGVKIATTDRSGSAGYETGNYTLTFSGTSSACPLVAGIAALVLSVNPNLTALEVRDIIEKTSEKVGSYSYTTTAGRPNGTWNQEMGYGLVNAYKAVLLASAIAPPTTDIEGRFYLNVLNGNKYIGMRGRYRQIGWPSMNPEFNTGATFSYININSDPPPSLLDNTFPNLTLMPMSYGWDDPIFIETAYLNETNTGKWYIGEFKYYNSNPNYDDLTEPLQLNLTELTGITSSQYNFRDVNQSTALSNIYYGIIFSEPSVLPITVNTLVTGNTIQLGSITPNTGLYNKTVYLNKLPNLTGH